MADLFVFGSNLAGRHGAGAAHYARSHFGAEYGVGHGLTGHSYALPTKDTQLQTLPLSIIKDYVRQFVGFAHAHPEHSFQVTRIGCGLAGYTDAEIAPLFIGAPSNCWFSDAWKPYLPEHFNFFEDHTKPKSSPA